MKHISIILMGFLLISSSCIRIQGHTRISIKNKSNKKIVFVQLINNDNLTCVNSQDIVSTKNWIILNHDTTIDDLYNIYNESWENRLSYEKQFVYFFEKDTFLKEPCDTFLKYKWYKKQELTLDYLNKNNWTITYP
jgi:hypothetical protein